MSGIWYSKGGVQQGGNHGTLPTPVLSVTTQHTFSSETKQFESETIIKGLN